MGNLPGLREEEDLPGPAGYGAEEVRVEMPAVPSSLYRELQSARASVQ